MTPAALIAASLPKSPETVTEDERKEANAHLRQHMVSLGYATGSDNESIDADLAHEYGAAGESGGAQTGCLPDNLRTGMEKIMAKKRKDVQELKIMRPKRAKLSEEETLRRMEAFDERKEQFIASVRKSRS
jgi:hypothetical protein